MGRTIKDVVDSWNRRLNVGTEREAKGKDGTLDSGLVSG